MTVKKTSTNLAMSIATATNEFVANISQASASPIWDKNLATKAIANYRQRLRASLQEAMERISSHSEKSI